MPAVTGGRRRKRTDMGVGTGGRILLPVPAFCPVRHCCIQNGGKSLLESVFPDVFGESQISCLRAAAVSRLLRRVRNLFRG